MRAASGETDDLNWMLLSLKKGRQHTDYHIPMCLQINGDGYGLCGLCTAF